MNRRTRPAERRVVVTGMGMVTPVGNDVPSSWQALLAGKSGGALISHFEATDDFPTRVAAEVKGFDPTLYMDSKEARRFGPVFPTRYRCRRSGHARSRTDEVPN